MQTESNITISTLNKFELTKADMEKFISDYSNLVVTPETFEQAKKARASIREKRYEIQQIEKSNNDQLNKLKKQNTSNALELIGVLTETEERIDKGIKAIEEEKERVKAEKIRLAEEAWNKRIAMLIETSATFNGTTFKLGERIHLAHVVKSMDEDAFDKCFVEFKLEADIIKEIKLQEEKEKKILQDKLDEERRIQNEIDAKIKKEQEDERFRLKLEQEKLDLEKKKQLDAIEEQNKLLQIEKDKIAKETAVLIEARTKQRSSSLLGIGMALTAGKFVFHSIQVTKEQVELLSEEEWIELTNITSSKISSKKEEIEIELAEAKAQKEALKPEREKLYTYLNSLLLVEKPELKSIEIEELLHRVINQIKSIQTELNNG